MYGTFYSFKWSYVDRLWRDFIVFLSFVLSFFRFVSMYIRFRNDSTNKTGFCVGYSQLAYFLHSVYATMRIRLFSLLFTFSSVCSIRMDFLTWKKSESSLLHFESALPRLGRFSDKKNRRRNSIMTSTEIRRGVKRVDGMKCLPILYLPSLRLDLYRITTCSWV